MMERSDEQPARGAKTTPAAKRRHPVRRWVLRLLFVLVGLIILAAVAIQIVLWTSFPKSIVVSQVEQGLGLRIGVTGLSTGWLGHTTMTGVKLALPLSDQSFVDVPEMTVRHTNLIALLLGWQVQIKAVELKDPVIYVRQDATGQWNLQQVVELVARAGGKKTGEQTAQTSSTPALPWLRITNLTANVIDNRHHELKISPINVSGEPETPVSWKYDVEVPSGAPDVPPHLSFLGRVAPGAEWAHEAHIWVHDIAQWVQPWKPGFNQPVTFDGRWSGAVTPNGVSGFLQISDSQFAGYHADGALSVSRDGDTFALSPQKLHLSGLPAISELRVPSGRVSYDGKAFTARQVQVALLGGPAVFSGWYQPDVRQAALEANWENLVIPKSGTTHTGKLDFTYSDPLAANLTVKLAISDSGTAPQGPFELVAALAATGQQLTDLTWRLDAPQLNWQRPQPIILNGLSAGGTYRQDAGHQVLRLQQVSLPADNRLAGTGFWDLQTQSGELHVSGQDWPVRLFPGTALAFKVDMSAKGVPSGKDPARRVPLIEMNDLTLRSADATLSLSGAYDGREPKPVRADVRIVNNPARPASGAQVGHPALVYGFLSAQATLGGTLDPQAIDINGMLDGRDATILGHPVGDIHTALHGAIDAGKAYVRADGIPFLGGIWNVSATHVTWEGDRTINTSEIAFSITDLPLQRVSQFLNTQPVNGTFQGSWYIYFPGLKPDPQRLVISGGATIRNFADSYFAADEVTLKTGLKDGTFTVDPVQARVGSYGRIDGRAQLLLSEWRRIHAAATFTAFPIEVSSIGLQLWGGSSDIELLLPDAKAAEPASRKLRATANLNIRSGVTINKQPEGEVRILAAMNERVLDLRELRGDLLGGTVSGDGVTDLDAPLQSRLNLAWNELQSDRFVRLYPQLKGFGGTFSGSARLEPATIARPLEPLALDAVLQSHAAHWRSVRIGNAQLHAYVGPRRFIADDLRPTVLDLSGGTVTMWFSASRHLDTAPTPTGQEVPTGVTISNLLNVTLTNLDMDPFVQSFVPNHRPGLGRLSGKIYTLSAPKTRQLAEIASQATYVPPTSGPSTQPISPQQEDMLKRLLRSTTVEGALSLDKSDLGNFGPIAFLYNAMHLGGGVRAPTGRGTVALRMEQGTLHIPNLYYFNRGIEVRGVMTATEMWNVPDNPLYGSAVGTARPLKSIKIPLFAEADAIISSLQGQLTSVEFKGTVRNPTRDYIRQLGLTQLGGELRAILLGDVGNTSGQ